MSNIIPFNSAELPAFIARGFEVTNDLLVSGNGGFPTISIKGKVFTLKRGDEKTLITKPGTDDEPASSLEVVILKAGPAGDKLAKVFYTSGFTEGSDAKPTCYSNDGIKPSANAQEPQSKTCAGCPNNIWGSRISEDGTKGKLCSDSKRLAIAPAGQINDPMLLRVPAASLKALTQFGQQLAKRGVPYQAVVAKIGFDYTVAHPALTFKPVGFVDEATMNAVKEMMESELVKKITGALEDETLTDAFDNTPVPAHVKNDHPAVKKTTVDPDEDPKPRVKVQVVADADEQIETPPAKVAKPAKPVVKEEPAPVAAKVAVINDAIDAEMDNLDFDD